MEHITALCENMQRFLCYIHYAVHIPKCNCNTITCHAETEGVTDIDENMQRFLCYIHYAVHIPKCNCNTITCHAETEGGDRNRRKYATFLMLHTLCSTYPKM